MVRRRRGGMPPASSLSITTLPEEKVKVNRESRVSVWYAAFVSLRMSDVFCNVIPCGPSAETSAGFLYLFHQIFPLLIPGLVLLSSPCRSFSHGARTSIESPSGSVVGGLLLLRPVARLSHFNRRFAVRIRAMASASSGVAGRIVVVGCVIAHAPHAILSGRLHAR